MPSPHSINHSQTQFINKRHYMYVRTRTHARTHAGTNARMQSGRETFNTSGDAERVSQSRKQKWSPLTSTPSNYNINKQQKKNGHTPHNTAVHECIKLLSTTHHKQELSAPSPCVHSPAERCGQSSNLYIASCCMARQSLLEALLDMSTRFRHDFYRITVRLDCVKGFSLLNLYHVSYMICRLGGCVYPHTKSPDERSRESHCFVPSVS